MSTKPEIVAHLKEQLAGAGPIRIQPMFGDFAVYLDEKIVGLISDGRLFIKKTPYGDAALGEGHDAPAYPGAKASLLIPDEKGEEAAWLGEFARKTAAELPERKPKKSRP